MRRWHLEGVGIEALKLNAAPVPTPGHGEVLVRVKAAAINARDLGILAGHYPNKPGVVPFSDGAGIIEAVGPGVSGFAAGDAVMGCFYPFWESGPADENNRTSLGCNLDGMLAEYALVPASGLVLKPATLDFAEAATLPCAALTAWTALYTEGGLRPGQTVLVQGTGGVAIFALQLAKLSHARVILLSGSDAKLERAKALGADVGINYRETPEWSAAVLDATGGKGADIVVEVGGQDTLAQSLGSVRVGGRISVVGVLSGLVAPVPVPPILFRHVTLSGITVGHRADFRALAAAVDAAGLKPVIDRRFAFEDAVSAFAELPTGKHFGKLVVDVDRS